MTWKFRGHGLIPTFSPLDARQKLGGMVCFDIWKHIPRSYIYIYTHISHEYPPLQPHVLQCIGPSENLGETRMSLPWNLWVSGFKCLLKPSRDQWMAGCTSQLLLAVGWSQVKLQWHIARRWHRPINFFVANSMDLKFFVHVLNCHVLIPVNNLDAA